MDFSKAAVLGLVAWWCVPLVAGETDCNGTSVLDSRELAAGFGLDCNNNSILDQCELAPTFSAGPITLGRPAGDTVAGDFNGDGRIDLATESSLADGTRSVVVLNLGPATWRSTRRPPRALPHAT